MLLLQEVASALRDRKKVEEALEKERIRQEKLAQSKELQEAEDIIKAAQEELAVITEMVQVKQAGQKLSESETSAEPKEKDGVQVDLDQMFSFLSDVQQTPMEEKQITDAGNGASEADEVVSKQQEPQKEQSAPVQQNGVPDIKSEQAEFKGSQAKELEIQKKDPAQNLQPTESKATAQIKTGGEKLPRTASPIKPEDTDSECNGDEDEEVSWGNIRELFCFALFDSQITLYRETRGWC